MRIGLAIAFSALGATFCSAQVLFPTYAYYLPASSAAGGPVYVIPGTVTDQSPINFSVTGQACEQSGGNECFNAAGVLTYKGTAKNIKVGETGQIATRFQGYTGDFAFGSLVMVVEGVGAVQVFQPDSANGLGSSNPPSDLALPSGTTFSGLGFSKFSVQNALIKFYIEDDYYSDNSQGFLLYLQSPVLTYDLSRPTSKIKQMNGPCDWSTWNLGANPCAPTAASQSMSEVLGNDLGFSFLDESTNQLIFLFGDTIGIKLPIGAPASGGNTYVDFAAQDAYATATLQSNPGKFTIDFAPKSPATPHFVTPYYDNTVPPTAVHMAGFDVPYTGIYANGEDYVVVDTGADGGNPGPLGPRTYSYSVLVDAGHFNGNPNTFTAGRTISVANAPDANSPQGYKQTGHFVFIALAALPPYFALQLGLKEPAILMVGNGEPVAESIYLAYIPQSAFWTGLDSNGKSATRYFAGLDTAGVPIWKKDELDAVPIVYDNPTGLKTGPANDPGTAGGFSLAFHPELGLWLMTWDGGRQSNATTGIYFSEASQPWGPWSTPQLIFNACDSAKYGPGYGAFMRYVASSGVCPQMTKDAGPEGPITGTGGDSFLGSTTTPTETAKTRNGHVYSPYMIPGLTWFKGSELTINYDMSTWNPYTAVLMQSNFTVSPPSFQAGP